MTYVEEAFALVAHADETLRHARINHREGLYRVAVSLAYYAAFYAAQAVIAYNREGPKSHQGVRNMFGQLAVRGSDFPGDVAGVLSDLAKSRVEADYDHATMDRWKEPDASEAMERAHLFITEVHAWFGRHHQPDTSG